MIGTGGRGRGIETGGKEGELVLADTAVALFFRLNSPITASRDLIHCPASFQSVLVCSLPTAAADDDEIVGDDDDMINGNKYRRVVD